MMADIRPDTSPSSIRLEAMSRTITKKLAARAVATSGEGAQPFDDIAILREALAVGEIGIWHWDTEAGIFDGDRVARRLWGLPECGLLPLAAILACLHPDDLDTVRSRFEAAQVSGQECHAIVRVRHPDKGEQWMRIRSRLTRVAGRAIQVGVTTDVTDRMRAAGAAPPGEDRMRRALALGGAVPFEWDLRGDSVLAGDDYNALFGLGQGGFHSIGAMLDRIHPEDRRRIEEEQQEALRSPGRFESEFRVVLPDQAIRWLLIRGETVLCDGVPTGIAGVSMDVTERKSEEHERRRIRRETKARFRELGALYQNAPVGLALLDRDLRYVRVNEFLAGLAGRPAEEHLGQSIFDVLPDLRVHQPVVQHVLETGSVVRDVDIAAETPGEPQGNLSIKAQFYPVRDERGELITGVGVLAEDVTARKRTEQARELLSRELSHRLKNLFAVVSSIITLSARGDRALSAFAQLVRGRIEALGRAHDYVRPTEWSPSRTEAPTLLKLLHTVLAPYQMGYSQAERVRIGGVDCPIGSGSATALALTFYELATNAAKYGALSTQSGSVEMMCRPQGENIEILWVERGGPPIDSPPVKQGFGSLLARRSLTSDLGGEVSMDWARDGLTVRVLLPLEGLRR